MNVIKPSYEILTKFSDGGIEELRFLEKIARTCYKSEDKMKGDDEATKRMIRNLIDNGHHAMIEHLTFTVLFKTDVGVGREITRHRIASFAQESTRYCNYSKDKFGSEIKVMDIREGLAIDPKYDSMSAEQVTDIYVTWLDAISYTEKKYMELIEKGVSPQIARTVLPLATEADLVVTMNYREWRHFFQLRAGATTGKPHPMMFEVASPLLQDMWKLLPVVFEDILPDMEMEARRLEHELKLEGNQESVD